MRFRLYRSSADGKDLVGVNEGPIDFQGKQSFVFAFEVNQTEDPYRESHPNILMELLKDDSDG